MKVTGKRGNTAKSARSADREEVRDASRADREVRRDALEG